MTAENETGYLGTVNEGYDRRTPLMSGGVIDPSPRFYQKDQGTRGSQDANGSQHLQPNTESPAKDGWDIVIDEMRFSPEQPDPAQKKLQAAWDKLQKALHLTNN